LNDSPLDSCTGPHRNLVAAQAESVHPVPAGGVQHPRHKVFIFASSFEFSASSTSKCGSCLVEALEAVALAPAIRGSDITGLSCAAAGFDLLGLAGADDGAVPS
jgi:hypothetical protein